MDTVISVDEDMSRERRINHYFRKMVSADTVEQKHEWAALMAEEIDARSPEQVARMERVKGLH